MRIVVVDSVHDPVQQLLIGSAIVFQSVDPFILRRPLVHDDSGR